MKKTIWSWILVVVVVACGWYFVAVNKGEAPMSYSSVTSGVNPNNNTSGMEPSSNQNSNQAPTPDSGSNSVSIVGLVNDPTLGIYLVDNNGMTLYVYSKDTKGVSNCIDTCTETWIPYVSSSPDQTVPPNESLAGVATITRADGLIQYTYKGAPLYYYKDDTNPGDTNGQSAGGGWSIAKQ